MDRTMAGQSGFQIQGNVRHHEDNQPSWVYACGAGAVDTKYDEKPCQLMPSPGRARCSRAGPCDALLHISPGTRCQNVE